MGQHISSAPHTLKYTYRLLGSLNTRLAAALVDGWNQTNATKSCFPPGLVPPRYPLVLARSRRPYVDYDSRATGGEETLSRLSLRHVSLWLVSRLR